ncbi:preprotein translocase YajC subunit [Clostridium sp. CAG:448]|nr:preprotein translocase YajC subunit [Clostridium sp. CAG:448]
MAAAILLTGAGNIWLTVGMIVVVVAVFYFAGIRPQKKQEKQVNEMRNNLQVGDEVTTIGGIIGKVVSIKEETFVLETTRDRTRIRFLKTAVSRIDVKAEDAK